MATANATQAMQVVHQAAEQLAALEWLDQEAARQISPLAEAVANMFVVLFYQAATGLASETDFRDAMTTVRQRLAN
ncbi:MAG: type I toxin-antitoxin system ptaRNA1 family toxin [Betaproteobacteria bacterium]|nr:type I toxin-antitoxin system ptaRNA1 family toxin [Betaproteobacteria bacterium]